MRCVRSETSWSMSRSPVRMTTSKPARLGLADERGDRVVRLEPLLLVDRDPERLDDLADLRDLVPHVVRHPRPGRLVLGVAVVAEGRLGQVEGDRDEVRLRVLDRAQDDVREPEHGRHELALRGRERLVDEREVAPVDEPVAVEQQEAFHGLQSLRDGTPEVYPRRASAHVRFRPGPRRDLHRACMPHARILHIPSRGSNPSTRTGARSVGPTHGDHHHARAVRRHPRRLHGPHRRGHRLPGRHLIDRGHRGRHERYGRLPRRLGVRLPVVRVPAVPVLPVPVLRPVRVRVRRPAARAVGPGLRPRPLGPVGRRPTAATRAASGSRTPIAGSTRRRHGTPARRPVRPPAPSPRPRSTRPGPRPADHPLPRRRAGILARRLAVPELPSRCAPSSSSRTSPRSPRSSATTSSTRASPCSPPPTAPRRWRRSAPGGPTRSSWTSACRASTASTSCGRSAATPPSPSSSSPPAATRPTASPASSSARTTTWSSRSAPRSSWRGSGPCSGAWRRRRPATSGSPPATWSWTSRDAA